MVVTASLIPLLKLKISILQLEQYQAADALSQQLFFGIKASSIYVYIRIYRCRYIWEIHMCSHIKLPGGSSLHTWSSIFWLVRGCRWINGGHEVLKEHNTASGKLDDLISSLHNVRFISQQFSMLIAQKWELLINNKNQISIALWIPYKCIWLNAEHWRKLSEKWMKPLLKGEQLVRCERAGQGQGRATLAGQPFGPRASPNTNATRSNTTRRYLRHLSLVV